MKAITDFQPNWASKPGNTILDLLNEKKISVSNFAKAIGQSSQYITDLIHGHAMISETIAISLSKSLGASTEFWLKREADYRTQLEMINGSQEELWLQELPLKDMIKFGWIQDSANKIEECLNFFNVPNITTWRKKYSNVFQNAAFRTSPSLKADQAATVAWLRRGEILAQDMECDDWNEEKFEATLQDIRKLTRKKHPHEFLPKLVEACSECGVSVVIARTPKGCRASGATYFINENRALLLLSFRYMSDDHFWFSFFHEAGHIILHKTEIPLIETIESNRNITEEESDANLFAEEALIPYDLQHELHSLRSNKRKIISFAAKVGISPGIVVGQMQHKGIIDHKYLNSYKRRYDWEDIISI